MQFSNGTVTTRCVQFNEASITGYDLIHRSQLPVAVDFGSFGATVCKIGNEGCSFPTQSCFCQCEKLDGNCTYWVYSLLSTDAWTISSKGAGNRMVRNGDVDGWRWGKGSGDSGEVPASVTFDSVCGASAIAQMQPQATSKTTPPTNMPQVIATELPTAILSPTQAALLAAISTPVPSTPNGEPKTPAATATTLPAATTPVAAPDPVNQQQSVQAAPQPSQATGQTPNLLPYFAFGAIALGLLAALTLLRRTRHNS